MTRLLIVLSLCIFVKDAYSRDDSERNNVASKIKKEVMKAVKRSPDTEYGYCDLMIEMRHDDNYAYIKRASYTGDKRVCKASKKALRVGKKYRYKEPEKYIRLHISH